MPGNQNFVKAKRYANKLVLQGQTGFEGDVVGVHVVVVPAGGGRPIARWDDSPDVVQDPWAITLEDIPKDFAQKGQSIYLTGTIVREKQCKGTKCTCPDPQHITWGEYQKVV